MLRLFTAGYGTSQRLTGRTGGLNLRPVPEHHGSSRMRMPGGARRERPEAALGPFEIPQRSSLLT
jgi:hypothetical protein